MGRIAFKPLGNGLNHVSSTLLIIGSPYFLEMTQIPRVPFEIPSWQHEFSWQFFVFVCLFFRRDQIPYQLEETQLVKYLDLPFPSDWTFLGQSCPSHMAKSSLWLLVSPCCRYPYRTQYKELSKYSGNSLHVTFPNSGPSWVLCPIAIIPTSMLVVIYCSVCLGPQQTVTSLRTVTVSDFSFSSPAFSTVSGTLQMLIDVSAWNNS